MKTTQVLSVLTQEACILEERICQQLTPNQLREIAQAAANSYHLLATQIITENQVNKKLLAELSKKFSLIEKQASMKFYGPDCVGPTIAIL